MKWKYSIFEKKTMCLGQRFWTNHNNFNVLTSSDLTYNWKDSFYTILDVHLASICVLKSSLNAKQTHLQ